MDSPLIRHILLVEDNDDDIQLTLRAFRRSNLTVPVTIARDGVEALDYLLCQGAYAHRDPCDVPTVVLLDINLPKVDGLQVLRAVRMQPRLKRLPVVVLTSSRQQEDILTSYDLGANSYIRKPVDFDEFMGAVQQLGVYWLTLNERPSLD